MIFFLVVPFLALGCAAFLVCAAIPPLQRFALGAALWCASCAPFLIGLCVAVLLCSAGIDSLRTFLHWNNHMFVFGAGAPHSWVGLLAGIVSLIVVAGGATIVSLLHGLVLRRLTLALFRIYLTAVSFGVGILSYAFLLAGLGSTGADVPGLSNIAIWGLGPFVAAALAYSCFVHAVRFRGAYPEKFQIVTPEEFGQA